MCIEFRYCRIIYFLLGVFLLSSCQKEKLPLAKEQTMREASSKDTPGTTTFPLEVRSKKITLQDGLSSNVVTYMYQDQMGFMWFCTHNGLARYDGNQMKVFLREGDNDLNPDSRVKKVTEDKTYKKMWVYTASETFYCLDMTTGKLDDYCSDLAKNLDKKYLMNMTKSLLAEDGLFYIWGNANGGLVVDYRKGSFKTNFHDKKTMDATLAKLQKKKAQNKKLLSKWNIPNAHILTDNKGGKWIYNRTGILRKIVGDSLVTLNLLPNHEVDYIDYERFRVVEDNHGLYWISTYGNGLFVFSHDLKQGQHFVADEKGDSPIVSNYLLGLIADRYDGVWVSAEYGGVAHIQVMDSHVERVYPNGKGNMDFSNVVRMVKKLRNGEILVSTRDGSLYRYSADMRQLLGKSHFDSNVYAVVESPEGKLWIGTRGKGVYGVDGLEYKDKKVFSMLLDNRKRLWIGTFGDGLSVATPERGRTLGENMHYSVKTFFADSVGLNEVRCLAMGADNTIWAGTSSGLVEMKPDGTHRVFKRSYEIHDMLFDQHGQLWLAVPSIGLVCVKHTGDAQLQFNVYDKSKGLVNDMVQSLVQTSTGDLIVPTQQGVSYWHAKQATFDSYLLDANPMGNVYTENSSVRLNDGRILLGGNYGLTIISTSHLRHVKGQTNVVFTNNPYSEELVLNHEENSPKIDFSTLDFSDVSNVKYMTWLEGYEKKWGTPSPTSFVTYHNLPFGSYVLHVKAAYSDGQWGNENVLKITVRPPFYLSVWAVTVYLFLLIVVLFYVYKNIRDKNLLKNKIKVEQELTKYKLVFFTNIAHEFRTPLTLIQGSLESEIRIMKEKGWQPELEHILRTMDKSVQRMLRLINQLLEFRKLQAGKSKLSLQETEVVSFFREIYLVFKDAAVSKSMNYTFESSLPRHLMYIDRQKLDKVLYNLLSNAFKYTPEQGSIHVKLNFSDVLTVRVSDTGVGIPKEQQEKLFSRFNQSSYTSDSFGIGLHLTHEIMELHQGFISYQANPGGGSVFVFTIPLDKEVYQPSDFLTENSPILDSQFSLGSSLKEDENDEQEVSVPNKQVNVTPLNSKVILLIEDDDDVRDFLANELRDCFEVKTASEGLKGIAMAKEFDIDLVVSDVMMPGINGFEVTKRLKNNFETSHIPIILLTALGTEESMLEGTESGADAYMTKPFSPQLLKARIFQLLEQREKLRQKFSHDQTSIRPSLCSTDKDQLFVRRLDAIIYSKIGDVNLTIDAIAAQLHVGRTIFYRKVRGITGYTPSDYLRVLRMKKAAELLKEGTKNISEVAYAVGYDNPNYFSKRFKEHFGVPPSQYNG